MKQLGKRNGDVIKGNVYKRNLDFTRDETKDLVRKLVNWSEDPTLNKYVPAMKIVLDNRLKKGKISEGDLNLLIAIATKKRIARILKK